MQLLARFQNYFKCTSFSNVDFKTIFQILSILHMLLPIFRSIQKVPAQLKRLSFRGERALRVRRATKICFLFFVK